MPPRARLLLLVVGLNACVTATPAPGTPSAAPPPSASASALPPDTQSAQDAAIREAVSHLGVPASQLRVSDLQRRTWPDSALGCPQPGVLYAQVVTPGFVVFVDGVGKQLEYHADTRGRAVLCREV